LTWCNPVYDKGGYRRFGFLPVVEWGCHIMEMDNPGFLPETIALERLFVG